MALYILGFAGSPRRGGNSEVLLDRVLAGAASKGAETEKIVVSNLKISPCRNCGGCEKTGQCVQRDDMQEIYPKLCRADRIVVSSPIFFGTVSAQLKALIDRCQSLWVGKYLLKQPIPVGPGGRLGFFLSVCGRRTEDYFKVAETTIKIFFLSLNVKYVAGLFFSGIDGKGDIERHPTALSQGFAAGCQLVTGQWSVAGDE